MLLFWGWWQFFLKHEEKKERQRVEALRQRGLLKEQRIDSGSSGQEIKVVT